MSEEQQNEQTAEQELLEPEVETKKELTCEEKFAELEDRYLRVHAEFENIKKRLEKEKYQAIDYASEKFARDLLPIIDTLELALQHGDADATKVVEGVKLTLDNLIKVFERNNITSIGHENGFDPNFHEAVMQTPSQDHEDNEIVMVLQKGYKLKDRMLRPSLVNVCKK